MESDLFYGASRDVVLRKAQRALSSKKIIRLKKMNTRYNIWYTHKEDNRIKRGCITLAADTMAKAKKLVKQRLPSVTIDQKGSCVQQVEYLVYYESKKERSSKRKK